MKKLEQIQQQKEEAKKNGTNISLENEEKARPFFASVEEKAAFEKAHEKKRLHGKSHKKEKLCEVILVLMPEVRQRSLFSFLIMKKS